MLIKTIGIIYVFIFNFNFNLLFLIIQSLKTKQGWLRFMMNILWENIHLYSRKEVIQPQVLLRLPCYDFTPVADSTVESSKFCIPASSEINSHGVTGGEYKTRERIHRSMADLRLLAIPASWSRVADSNPNWDIFYRFAPSCDIASHCICHCSTCVAPDIRAMMTWRRPHLPPPYEGSLFRELSLTVSN